MTRPGGKCVSSVAYSVSSMGMVELLLQKPLAGTACLCKSRFSKGCETCQGLQI